MDREVASIIRLAAGLMLLAAFLGLVVFTVHIGNQIKNSALEEGVDLATKTQQGMLAELRYNDESIPTASAYAIIEQHYDHIGNVECRICEQGKTSGATPINEFSCIKSHLSGKLMVEIVYVKSKGLYDIVLHKEDCNWLYSENNECDCM